MLILYKIIQLNNSSTFIVLLALFIMLLKYDLFMHSNLILWVLNLLILYIRSIDFKLQLNLISY